MNNCLQGYTHQYIFTFFFKKEANFLSVLLQTLKGSSFFQLPRGSN